MKVLKGTRAHSQIRSSLGLSRTPPSSEFLWLFSHCVPSTVRRRCDMRVQSGSIHPFACGFRFAQRTDHCDGLCEIEREIIPLQREGNLELCALFSRFFLILNHFPDITCQSAACGRGRIDYAIQEITRGKPRWHSI
jgi:hypothetical protein